MLLEISVVVVAAFMSLTCVVLIIALVYVIKAVKSIERLAETVRPHVAPITHDITIITQKAAGIMESVQRQTAMIEESVTTFRDATRSVRHFQQNLLEKFTFPAVKLSRLGRAVKVGFETVFNRLFHRQESLPE
jgi:uncharacterized protein YoxC